jgi:hypothetical protein
VRRAIIAKSRCDTGTSKAECYCLIGLEALGIEAGLHGVAHWLKWLSFPATYLVGPALLALHAEHLRMCLRDCEDKYGTQGERDIPIPALPPLPGSREELEQHPQYWKPGSPKPIGDYYLDDRGQRIFD